MNGEPFSYLMHQLLLRNPEPVAVEVGANDGYTLDYLAPFIERDKLARVVLVEPQKDLCRVLRSRHGSRLHFVSIVDAAIAEKDGFGKMIIQSRPGRVDMEAKLMADWSQPLPTPMETVRVITVQTLATEQNLRHIDVLVTDCEGMDYVVVKGFLDFMFRPVMIQFEHTLLPLRKLLRLRLRLSLYGYKLVQNGMNTIAHKL